MTQGKYKETRGGYDTSRKGTGRRKLISCIESFPFYRFSSLKVGKSFMIGGGWGVALACTLSFGLWKDVLSLPLLKQSGMWQYQLQGSVSN